MNSKGLAAMFLAASIAFFPPAFDSILSKPPEATPVEDVLPVCRQSCMNKFGRGAEIILRVKSEDEKKHQKGSAGKITPTFEQAGIVILESVLKNSRQIEPSDREENLNTVLIIA